MRLKTNHYLFDFSLHEAISHLKSEMLTILNRTNVPDAKVLLDTYNFEPSEFTIFFKIVGYLNCNDRYEMNVKPLNGNQTEFSFGLKEKPNWHTKYCVNVDNLSQRTLIYAFDYFISMINEWENSWKRIIELSEKVEVKDVLPTNHTDTVEVTLRLPKSLIDGLI